MLQAIRDGSKGLVAKIIVGLIIVTFALFGIESIVALGGGEDAPATVNGQEITEMQVQHSMQMQKRRLQAQLGENFDPAIFKEELIRQASVESLINEAIVVQAAKDAGIIFSASEIDKMIVNSPDFQVNGKFDRNQFDLVLRSAGFTRFTYRELLRTSLLASQIQNSWQASSFSTPYEAKLTAELESQTRDFSLATLSLDEVKQDTVISDEEISAYYNENANAFMTQEKVSVKYIELDSSKLSNSIDITEDEVLEQYETIKAEANSKKEYRAAHILLLESDEAAKKKMAEIQTKLASGQSFEELAKEYSEDDTSKFSGGDLGFADETIYETEFADALVTLNVNEVSPVVETRDGFHLIKLLDVRQPEVAAFNELKDSIKEDLRKEAVQLVYLESLETLKDQAFSALQIEPVAETLGLEVKKEGPFSKAGGQGIAAQRSIVNASFSELVLDEGANSEVIELSDSRAVVVHLDEYFESRVKPLEDVSAQIKQDLTNIKALEALALKAEEALEAAKAGNYQAQWKTFSNKTRSFTGAPVEVVTKAFTLAANENNESYDLVELKNGDKAIIRLENINRESVIDVTDSHKQKISRIKSTNEFEAFFNYHQDKADIEKS